MDLPVHIVLLPVMVHTGNALAVITFVQVLVHPAVLVTVTLYVPAAFTVIQLVVAPLLHKYEAAPVGTHNCVDCPGQIAQLPVMVQTGLGDTVTAWLQVLVHPASLVTVTLYVPAAFTVIQLVVAPLLHK